MKRIREVKEKLTKEQIDDVIAEHIAQVQSAMDRFNIQDPCLIVKLHETGILFKIVATRSFLKGDKYKEKNLFTIFGLKKVTYILLNSPMSVQGAMLSSQWWSI